MKIKNEAIPTSKKENVSSKNQWGGPRSRPGHTALSLADGQIDRLAGVVEQAARLADRLARDDHARSASRALRRGHLRQRQAAAVGGHRPQARGAAVGDGVDVEPIEIIAGLFGGDGELILMDGNKN